jgi:ribonuclease HI
MNLIFHNLQGILMEVYIDDVVIKSFCFTDHLADLRVALERMKKYGLRMNPFKCAFGVSTGHFLGFIVHEHGIQIDPKKVKSIQKFEEPACKRDV